MTDPSEGRQFSQVISGLQKSYPKDKMEEISTSFCFICLLHLANEQGLKLQAPSSGAPDDDGGDEVSSEEQGVDKVADIWTLKVYLFQVALHAFRFLVLTLSFRSSETQMPHKLHDE